MGTLYIDTGGSANNSGSTDAASPDVTLTINAGEAFGDTTLLVDVNTGALTSIVTSGANQSTVCFPSATNANKKLFWISAYDDVASPKTITVDTIPTGLTAGTSTGSIGGQYTLAVNTGFSVIDSASTFRAGDIIIINNSPATGTQNYLTTRAAGSNSAGFVTVKGKAGGRPVLTVSNTTNVLSLGAFASWKFENLELVQQGASGAAISGGGSSNNIHFYNIKVSDAGGAAGEVAGVNPRYIACEFSGAGGAGIGMSQSNTFYIFGTYIHDVTGDGVNMSAGAANITAVNMIIDTAAGRGILNSGTPSSPGTNMLFNCTIYGCGNSGWESNDADINPLMFNCIFSENGNAAGEYNIEFLAGSGELLGMHGWNTFFKTGGSNNLLNLTVDANVASSEFTTDPSFTDPAAGDFSISSSSPAYKTGFPGQFLGGSLGYLSQGAVQPNPASGGGGSAVGYRTQMRHA
jgi:hypothetical protein